MDTTLLELVDAAYELVEIYKPESPAQETWRLNWLEKARKAAAVQNQSARGRGLHRRNGIVARKTFLKNPIAAITPTV
jgi:hypothetical protein